MIYQIKNIFAEKKRVNVCWLDCSESDFIEISLLMYGTKEHYTHIFTSNPNPFPNELVLSPLAITVSARLTHGSFLSTTVKFAHLRANATYSELIRFIVSIWYASSYSSVVCTRMSIKGAPRVS